MSKFVKKALLLAGLAATVMALAASVKESEPASEKHEQQWIVNSIGQDIEEILLFAAKQNGAKEISFDKQNFTTKETAGNTEKYSFELAGSNAVPAQSKELSLTGYVWEADNYVPWAQQLITALKLTASQAEAKSTDNLAAALSNFSPEIIAKENKRVSEGLTARPLDPSLHQEAALLCALFALRETASCFTDVRPALNRISTHLSLAKALTNNSAYDLNGKLAEATLLSLCGRGKEAIERIDAMSAETDPAVQSWLRALKIRTTYDYRIADLKNASILERLQYGRALADDIGSDYLTDYLKEHKPDGPAIDWLRIGSRGVASIESGHVYSEPGVDAEMATFLQDYKVFKGGTFNSAAEANAALSQSAGRCLVLDAEPNLQAISWSDVCAFDCRHLVDSLFQKYYFEESMWGVRDEAKAFAAYTDKVFSNINLFPLYKMSRLWADETKADDGLDEQLKTLIREKPELVNSNLWHRILKVSAKPYDIEAPLKWFVPRFPYGTTFDFAYRNFENDPHLGIAEMDSLRAINPYNLAIERRWAAVKYNHAETGSQLAEAFGVLSDIDVHAMEAIAYASRKDPVKHAEQLIKIARYKPDLYFELGSFYVEQKQPEKAKEAFENGVKLGRDSVIMANGCDWLVNYYFDHGQKDKAFDLANKAAEVYSGNGLETMAKLYEKMGKLKEAEDYFAKIKERYDDSAPLDFFYHRHAQENERYKKADLAYQKKIFPAGSRKLDPSQLKTAPTLGILVTSESDLTQKFGLHHGEIIVSVAGTATDNKAQYTYMMDSNHDDNYEFTVWNGKEYRTVKAVLPKHRWGINIEDYKAH